VKMITNSSGQIYSHPATFVKGADRVFNMGGYQFFLSVVETQQREIVNLCGPHFNTDRSIFLTSILDLLSNTQAMLSSINNYKNYWKNYVWGKEEW